MKRAELQDIPSEQLVERFATLALAQDRALLMDDIANMNRLYRQLKEVENELKAREGDQRLVLLALNDHPNAQVRVKAVKATLAVAPTEARRQLQIIADPANIRRLGRLVVDQESRPGNFQAVLS